MFEDYKYKISVITAAYNAESYIENLIESLRAQQDKDFEWVVVDGTSTDKTLEILYTIDDLNIKIISEPDFGIYDALNKGIKSCSGEYYLVAGADDIFFPNAIKDYRNFIDDKSSLITAGVLRGSEIAKVKRGPSWRYGYDVYISVHALGVLIKKDLHLKYGYYSKNLSIAADQLFIKRCCQDGIVVKNIDIIVGEFGTNGISSVDLIASCTDFFRVQLMTEKNKKLVSILFLIRLFRRLIKEYW